MNVRVRAREPGWTPRRTLQLAALAAVLVALAVAAFAYRAHHRRQVVAQALERAQVAFGADTHAGWLEASRLLEPIVELDRVNAGALRAFVLAMLALDYRDDAAGEEAERLLEATNDGPDALPWADLASAASSLRRKEAGTALGAASRAGDLPWGRVLVARVALLAGKLDAAREPLDRATAADPAFPAAQALRGDALRRSSHAAQAREAYLAALRTSPRHPRSTYGLAKLALAGAGSYAEAREALKLLVEDVDGTPQNERNRAAYHLAAIEARSGDRAASAAVVDRTGVSGAARSWIDRAVDALADARTYRVIDGPPPPLQSASDDDPYVPPPPPPPSTAISPTFRIPDPPPRPAAAAPAKKRATATTTRSKTSTRATAKASAGSTARRKATTRSSR